MADKIVILDETDKVSIESQITNHTSDKSNPHGVTVEQIGAVSKTGDTMTGSLKFQKVNNGHTELFKNHNDTDDYGTLLLDKALDGKEFSLGVSASTQSINVFAKNSSDADTYQYSVYHTGNKPLPVHIGAASNKNLLDNWYFPTPINQRWGGEYTANGYTIDRWAITNGKLTLSSNGVILTGTNENAWAQFYQVPSTYNLLGGHTFTFSVIIDNILYSITKEITYVSFPINIEVDVADGIKLAFYRASADTTLNVCISAYYGKSITIQAAKLEYGNIQTLAYYSVGGTCMLSDPIPNMDEELQKCRKYYQSITNVYAYGHTAQDMAYVALPTHAPMYAIANYVCNNVGKLYVGTTMYDPVNVYPISLEVGFIILGVTLPGMTQQLPAILCDASINLSCDL